MIGVIVLKQFQKFVKVKNGTPFKNSLFFYFMLIHHLSNVEHGATIREPKYTLDFKCTMEFYRYSNKF